MCSCVQDSPSRVLKMPTSIRQHPPPYREINTISFCTGREHILMAGDTAGGITFWDLRVGQLPQLHFQMPDVSWKPTQMWSLATDCNGDVVVSGTSSGQVVLCSSRADRLCHSKPTMTMQQCTVFRNLELTSPVLPCDLSRLAVLCQ